jgi:hypothetical protein
MLHIIYNENKQPIGWELRPNTPEEQKTAAIIRDLQFFGFDDTHIEYAGISLIDPKKGKTEGNLASVSWKQQKYIGN